MEKIVLGGGGASLRSPPPTRSSRLICLDRSVGSARARTKKEDTKESVSGPMSTLTLHGNGGPVSPDS